VLTGRAFVQLDNLRYKLDSTVLETLLTSPNHSLGVRVPHRGLLTVSTKGLSIYITSKGVQTTDDQADRSCFVRILKQPDGYPFEVYPEGGILKHVRANQGHYLGCVHRILQEWIARGKPTTNEARHRWMGCDGVERKKLQLRPLSLSALLSRSAQGVDWNVMRSSITVPLN
jgi:hypothetical protein